MNDNIKPVSAGDPNYPNPDDVAKCLRNCKDDLETEARFVLWQAEEIKRLTSIIDDMSENGYELAGIVADVKWGNGFDDVCLQTLRRVEASLYAKKGPNGHPV